MQRNKIANAPPMELPTPEAPLASQWFNSAQLLLSEKRTSLSVLRTGVGIFVLPLSVLRNGEGIN